MDLKRDGVSTITRLQHEMMPPTLGLTSELGPACEINGMFADVMARLPELRQEMTKRLDKVNEIVQYDHGKLKDELADKRSRANYD